jgi:hypothetical protein
MSRSRSRFRAQVCRQGQRILLAYTQTYLTYEIHDSGGRTGDKASAAGRATAAYREAAWVIAHVGV